MKKVIISILGGLLFFKGHAQRITAEQYIELYRDIAVSEMKRTGIPAAITLAQGILETESGNSELVKKSNNHFGIKCKNTWTGTSVTHDDDLEGECFRSYSTAAESFKDHSDFLLNNTRYSNLLKLDVMDYKSWAYGLKRAGYATNPLYPQILIKNIEQYGLQKYNKLATGAIPGRDSLRPGTQVSLLGTGGNGTMVKSTFDSLEANVIQVSDNIRMVNKCKCVMAKKGTSLLALATRNSIPLSKLLEFNELEKDGLLQKDQYVFLQKKSKIGEMENYTVRPGESLYDIAQKNGIALQNLADYNKIGTSDRLDVGRILKLQLVTTATLDKTGYKKAMLYIVKPNEGLYSIARKYHVSIQQLKDWNNLNNDLVKTGQELIVSE